MASITRAAGYSSTRIKLYLKNRVIELMQTDSHHVPLLNRASPAFYSKDRCLATPAPRPHRTSPRTNIRADAALCSRSHILSTRLLVRPN